MYDRYYIDETCSVCDTECGSRLCDDCKADTVNLFRALMLDNFNSDQRIYLASLLDGVYLTDFVNGGKNENIQGV